MTFQTGNDRTVHKAWFGLQAKYGLEARFGLESLRNLLIHLFADLRHIKIMLREIYVHIMDIHLNWP